MLKAFCRVAPSVLFNFLAIREAGVFLFAIVFSSRTSPEVHARRFFALLAIEPPFQMQTTCIPCGNKRKAERRDGEHVCCTQPPDGFDHKCDLVRFLFNKIWPRKQIFLPLYQDNFAVANRCVPARRRYRRVDNIKKGSRTRPPPWKTPGHLVTNTRTNFTRGRIEQHVVRQRRRTWEFHRQTIRPVLGRSPKCTSVPNSQAAEPCREPCG